MDSHTISLQQCLRCGHRWFPRSLTLPLVCPSCTSAYWNRPRKDGHVETTVSERSE